MTVPAPAPDGQALPPVLIEGLEVRFGDVLAVAGISLRVEREEVFGLLGPNGAGKTTTLRVLTTLLAPTAGRALVAGHDVRRESLAVRESIGYVPQALSADGALTVEENLDLYARVSGVPRSQRRPRIEAAIEAMQLDHSRDRLARTLSGGMLRRLEIASALLNRPAVLFLDEPTVGLDPAARGIVWERLDEMRETAGTTVLVTTHLMEEAERHCGRLAIVDRGLVVEEGRPQELLARHGAANLEEVFRAVAGHPLDDDRGRFADVRAQRRVAGRLG